MLVKFTKIPKQYTDSDEEAIANRKKYWKKYYRKKWLKKNLKLMETK